MPSGLDILEGNATSNIIKNAPKSNLTPFDVVVPNGVDPNTMAKAIVEGGDVKSGMELLNIKEHITKPTDVTPSPTPKVNVDAYDPIKIFEKISPKVKKPKAIKPSSITPDMSNGVSEALRRIWGLATHPYDIVKGSVDLISSIPGFIEGIIPATWELSKALGQGANLNEAYNAASKGMEEANLKWRNDVTEPLSRLLDSPKRLADKVADKYLGMKPREEDYSGVVSDIAMAPLNMITKATHDLADSKAYDNFPTTRGAIKFGGDILGLITLGRLYKGGPTELAKDVKPIIEKADAINKKQLAIDKIPDEILKKAQEKVLEVEKTQLELEAKLLQERMEHETIIEEDLKIKGQEIQDIKNGKKNFFEDPFGIQKEIDIIDTKGKEEGKKQYEEIIEDKRKSKRGKKIEKKSDEPIKTGMDILEPTVEKQKKVRAKKEPDTLDGLLQQRSKLLIELPAEDPQVVALTKKITKLTDKLSKEIKKQPAESEPITLYHRTNDKAIKNIDYDAYFGDESFEKDWNNEFGNYRHSIKVSPENQKKIIDLNSASPEAKDFISSVIRTIWGDTKDARDFITDISHWKKEAVEEFYDIWTDKALILPEIRNRKLLGASFRRETLLTKEGIKKLGETKKAAPPKQPVIDVDLQTGTSLPEALNTENHPFRDKRVEHTNSMKKIFQEKVNKMDASPEVFTRYLINEVNRYLNGEEVDIKKVRYGLSEVAARADNLRLKFDDGESFNAWRDTAKAAAQWARGADRLIDKRTGGTKLNMGLDPTQIPEATKKIITGAKALAAYTAKARGMKEWNPKAAANMIKEEFTRSFTDRSGNIRKELLDKLGDDGYEIIQKMYLSKGASSWAAQELKQMRNEVYAGLNKNDKRILDNLILADRMLDIGKYKTTSQFKFPEGLSPIESAAYNELFQFIEKLTPEKADLLKQRAQAYFEWMKKPLKDMLDAELITEEEYNNLVSHNYRRLKLVDVFDKRYQSKIGKTKRTVYDSGVESLAHGRETDVFEPSSEVMALEVFNRAYGRILNNAANKTLLDLAREQKDNPFVAVKESPSDRIPSGWDRIFVYEKGERKALYLSPEMAKEWITNNPEMSYRLSQFIRYASGSPVLRTFATGIDWGFALANLPRDIMHIWYAARVFENGKWTPTYNTAMPVYFGQMGADIGGVFHDAVLRKGKYLDYIDEGGGMEFLVHQGRLMQRGRHIEGGLDKVQDFLGYFGETSEIMTRLAVRDRVIKRRAAEQGISYEEAYKDKKIRQEATFAARDYMDFGQGGGISKALDNGLPYLNASIQGTRGMFRSFKDNPLQSTVKLAQFAALVTGLYIANQALNPETLKAIKGDIANQGNLIIPLGDGLGFDDEKGQRRYPYIKIPLDPGQKFFKMFFEASYDKATGQPVDAEGVANSLSQISPVAISSLPPTLSGSLGYMYNKDFWKNDDIWKKTDKPLGWPESKEEYIPGQTPQALIDVGSITGLSPERLKYALSELVTSGSMWSWLVGQGYDAAFHDLPQSNKEMHLAEVLAKTPMVKRFIGITNPYTQYATPIEQAREESMLKRWIENRGLDQRVESYLYEGGKREDVIDYIRTTAKDQATMERLKDRFVFQEKIKGLPNRSFWLSLKGTSDIDARAKLYVQRFDSATAEEKNQLIKEIGIVQEAGGVISDEFKQAVMRYRDKK